MVPECRHIQASGGEWGFGTPLGKSYSCLHDEQTIQSLRSKELTKRNQQNQEFAPDQSSQLAEN
jgi:hypothetical protein